MADISSDYLKEFLKNHYSLQVVVTAEKWDIIELETRQQSRCKVWREERMKRITASHVGGIVKMRAATKRSKKVKEMLYTTFKGNKATMYGMLMEDVAQQKYVEKQQQNHPGLKTEPSGLVVSLENPWLAASPDGRVTDPSAAQPIGLVEYKNPYSTRDSTIEEACASKGFCLEKTKKGEEMVYSLRSRHNYYYQVQCQLYCCNLEWCDFVVHTEKDMHIERIERNKDWWEEQLPKLKEFYFNSLLPELASPRYRNGGIRESGEQSTSTM